MKKRISVSILGTVFFLLLTHHALAAPYSEWDAYEKEVFALTNLQRSHWGLPQLVADSRLQEAADLHSQDMAENDYFSHTGSDNSSPFERIAAQGYDWQSAGENIAAGYTMSRAVMYGTSSLSDLSAFDISLGNDGFDTWDEVGINWNDDQWSTWGLGWMGSDGHRSNILYNGYTDLGVGYFYEMGDSLGYFHYWTQNFASGDTAAVPLPPAVWFFGSAMLILFGMRRRLLLPKLSVSPFSG